MIRPQIKPVRHIEKKYRDWIKTFPCLLSSVNCLAPIDPHHVIPKGGGKMGSKVSDRRCVPACRYHHEILAQNYAGYGPMLETAIRSFNARYNREHPQRLSRVRVKRHATLKIEGVCPKRHRVNVAPGKLVKVKGVWRWWCDRCSEYMEVA